MDHCTKIKFSIKDFFSKRNQIRRKLRIWSHLLKKSLMENLVFCAVDRVIQLFSYSKKLFSQDKLKHLWCRSFMVPWHEVNYEMRLDLFVFTKKYFVLCLR